MAWKVVKQIVAYARSKEQEYKKKFRFTFTTNGMLLNDEVTEFLNQEMYNVVLSLDGRKEVHDRLRQTVNGKGSYDHIVPKFKEFVRKRGDQEYYVRGTYTRNNVDFTNDIFHIADLGFDKISMEPVICDPKEPYALTEEDLPEIYNQYEILAKEMIGRGEQGKGFTFYHYMLDLSEGPCIQKRITGCGSGTEYLAVTPWGELFLVTSSSGMKNTAWETSGMGSHNLSCNVNSKKATATRSRNARTAGLNSTAAVVVLPMHCTRRVPSSEPMTSAVTSSAKESNVP